MNEQVMETRATKLDEVNIADLIRECQRLDELDNDDDFGDDLRQAIEKTIHTDSCILSMTAHGRLLLNLDAL